VAKKPIEEKKRLNYQELENLVASADVALKEFATVKGIDDYDRIAAQMFAVSADGFVRYLNAYPDVYSGLKDIGDNHSLKDHEVGLVCETVGWASPHDGLDCEPSKHPQRKRVRLVALATKTNQMVSSVHFQDETETVLDFGKAQGSLADALRQTLLRMLRQM